ncbi:PIG-L family deacetylase [Methanobacterium sp.]|uniref:PIG-L family deacetylase n=1 Tax=Methanobacterium sp. TaxID=2164 RepID=UPI002AB9A445|nr:PIG-L family deacetylase [Methanobacterium sp.]MDY9923305.1 PIG-L family deacetylase [Methanobacterium sp.]
MKKTFIILLLAIPLILFIALFPIFSVDNQNSSLSNNSNNNNNNTSESPATGNITTNTSPDKVAFIIPHPDDETIGVGGTIQRIMENGSTVHFELMTSGDAVTSQLLTVKNYYNIEIPSNSTADYRKKLIREDSFKRVMAIFGTHYNIQSFDDGALNSEIVFTTMENLYLKEGYTVFYTTTGDGNGDHLACQQGMAKMKEKYPNLKYRQFPIYYYHTTRAATTALTNNYTDVNVNTYAAKKKSAFQVYYNINTILNTFYPYSDGLYSIGPERIYYIN